ncbi:MULTISPECIES: hypothetical protein [Paenibacillus]|uniref:Uncharacterized protein n=1 Tax=Paenibacillus sabinae T27 TaxID=1268072 RepID=X4ZWR5_9BACL|nr:MULTISPECIES: hypothetical protein [Paenibacillus]AHV96149.1 hypothetical protein PSAB_06065 [Paenibacillus sabinae T27]NJJ38548.1 hypothetical protein [Paenibacillus apii]
MKLFKLEIGNTITYAAAESQEDMEQRKADVDAQFAFLPVQIEELTLEGYEITVTPLDAEEKPRNKGGRPRKDA